MLQQPATQTMEEQQAAERRAIFQSVLKYGGGPMAEVLMSTAVIFLFWGSKVGQQCSLHKVVAVCFGL